MARKKKDDFVRPHTGHSSLYDDWADQRRNNKVKSTRYRSTIIGTVMVCTIIFVALWGASALVKGYLTESEGNVPVASLTPTPAPTVIPTPSPTPPTVVSQPMLDAIAKNSEVIGWIKIDGTVINYPVVQGEDNEFYITHGYGMESNDAGAIFMDVRCNPKEAEEQLHYILYGTNMEDGSRFTKLGSYLEEDFFNQHRYITLDLLSGNYTFEVFAAYIIPESDDFDYTQVKFRREPLWLSFIQSCQKRSARESDVKLNSQDVMLTLSTYLNPSERSKVVVHAKLVK